MLTEVAEASTWGRPVPPGTWSVAMAVVVHVSDPGEGCSDLTDVLWTGSRVAWVSVVGDGPTDTGEPDTTIDFADEPSARAWVEGAEAAAVMDLLESLELTAAPILDAAP